ncbi:adenylosuccinate lyase [Orenia metallireducens]|jgi:adenylosuccinate lyase|uniref:Adenylosuccinate lyase n=1 Tax=Orenia metallireducens TaxID=1413210 RepID=A0A285G1P5_9FIRM|nr:adenylosuccinate lyase [Orenia metallireducens]PRX31818.1 adenylosuccinate lyase [Orenia metallireducens]SNY17490.1 adenylosuccinate lyase [Orenia metallireducens]
MINRYTLAGMKKIWDEENKFNKWLDIEIAVCEALTETGEIPQDDMEKIKENASFSVDRIKEIESKTRHDILAFLTAVAESLGEESKYIHMGLTSSDVKDTARALQMKESLELILDDLQETKQALARQAKKYKMRVMIGRTHGVHAEPVTLGLKLANWYSEINRHIERVEQLLERISVGKISGAVGTFANISPKVEELACKKLGIKAAAISSQILQRDRHAEYLSVMAIIASSLDKFATEIRNLQRTDILEIEESFKKGQKGSSAMPHKKNPITCERISGLSRVVKANANVGFDNVNLWHERDLTHSSPERVVLPDSSILIDYMLNKFTDVVDNLAVYEENMEANLAKTKGLIFSQKVMLSLVDKGLLRDDAYAIVQRNALEAWNSEKTFKELLLADSELTEHMKEEEVEQIFDYSYHLKNIDVIYQRLGLN